MKALRDKKTKEILYVGESLALSEKGLTGTGFTASNITSIDYEIIETTNVPNDFTGRAYMYDNGWTTTDYGKSILGS